MMAIYTRFGDEVKIFGNCGQVLPDGFKTEQTLLAVVFVKEKKLDYYFADFLRADGGWQEIRQAMSDVPNFTLNEDELRQAIKAAL